MTRDDITLGKTVLHTTQRCQTPSIAAKILKLTPPKDPSPRPRENPSKLLTLTTVLYPLGSLHHRPHLSPHTNLLLSHLNELSANFNLAMVLHWSTWSYVTCVKAQFVSLGHRQSWSPYGPTSHAQNGKDKEERPSSILIKIFLRASYQ